MATIVPLIIDGKDVPTPGIFPVVSPLNNKHVWDASAASIDDATTAVEAAQRAFPAWSKTKPSTRRDILLRAADIVTRRREELGEYMHQEIGADKGCQDFNIDFAIEALKDTAGRIAAACAGVLPESIREGKRAMVFKRPYGVVLGIAPWNAPYILGFRAVIFALAVGNTVVLKGPELSPRCYWGIVDVLREAGLPPGCVNLILHQPVDAAAITSTLVAHPAVKKINFTGSTRVGSIVSSQAGKYLKPVLMELGGKASAIVMPDADLEKAALYCTLGAFIWAGQVCMSTERIIVHSSIADEFQEILKKTVNKLYGSVATTPIVVTEASATRNRALIDDALSKGAGKLGIFSGNSDPNGGMSNGHEDIPTHMRPVVLTGVNKTMTIYEEESFGPSASLFVCSTEDEMIALANDTEYGLTASVYAEDLRTAFRIADRIESGAVHINAMTIHDELALPHGGIKGSGFGRFNGSQGLEEFMCSKVVTWME